MVIDGKAVAKQIREEIAVEVSKMKEAMGVIPGLAVILVGDRKDSATYVRNKKKACESVGINSLEVNFPEDSTEEEVLNYILGYNDDPAVHGILVQLSLPSHMDEQNVLNAVRIEKDVDGFHPLNIGRLAMRGRDPLFVPCTPKGCIELLHRYDISIKGKRAVVIGRSNIVGMPAALLLQREDATVSVVHSRTSNPEEITRQADILISAVGQPNMVRSSWMLHWTCSKFSRRTTGSSAELPHFWSIFFYPGRAKQIETNTCTSHVLENKGATQCTTSLGTPPFFYFSNIHNRLGFSLPFKPNEILSIHPPF